MIREQLTHGNAQFASALVAAWAFGLWTGINYVGQVAPTTYSIDKPAWIGQAEWAAWASLIMLAVAVGGWIALDYRKRQQTQEEAEDTTIS